MSYWANVHSPWAVATLSGWAAPTSVNVGEYIEGQLFVKPLGLAGGSPKLAFHWQTSPDNVRWVKLAAMATLTAATGLATIPLSTLGQYGRPYPAYISTGLSFKVQVWFVGKWRD